MSEKAPHQLVIILHYRYQYGADSTRDAIPPGGSSLNMWGDL
jgi:hypothetical protein